MTDCQFENRNLTVSDDHNQNETNMQSVDEPGDGRPSSDMPHNTGFPWPWDFARALALLSRVPVPGMGDFRPKMIARSVWCWPLVGLFLSGVALLPAMLAQYLTGNGLIFAIFAAISMVLLTGAMHEDGLADCADGFGGGVTRDRKLEIMRDSHIGTYGVVALVLCLALRLVLLETAAGFGQAMVFLVVVAVMSRAAMPVLMRLLPPARDNGLGKGAGRPGWMHVAVGVALAAGIVWFLAGVTVMLAVLGGGVIATGLVGLVAKRQIGGQTGDVLGATQLVAELFAGIGFVAVMGHFS